MKQISVSEIKFPLQSFPMIWKTEQENFWADEFGQSYMERNNSAELNASNLELFSTIIRSMKSMPHSVLEFGANIGMNIKCLKELLSNSKFYAVEINSNACQELRKLNCEVFEKSILDFEPDFESELVFTKGVLIHIDPSHLREAYKLMYNASSKYILCAEYYNPTPVAVHYRGFKNRLFKRDFAGEILDLFPDLKLVNYGFSYHRGQFPQDDTTWFLLEKNL
jgi:pseudaminic acid biosynthesis-associated methylase